VVDEVGKAAEGVKSFFSSALGSLTGEAQAPKAGQ
jgi:hypothetical protein